MNPPLFLLTVATIAIVLPIILPAFGQIMLLPSSKVGDPFKDNHKWAQFQLEQEERLKELKVLVDNVWNLVDEIESPSPTFDFSGQFIKFHFQAFVDFFHDLELQMHGHSVYSTINTAIGIQNISSLYEVNSKVNRNEPADSTLNALRLQWIQLHEMAQIIHVVFNQTSARIFGIPPSSNNTGDIFELVDETHPVWTQGEFTTNGTIKMMSIQDLGKALDSEIESAAGAENGGGHVLRGLVQLLSNMEQIYVDMNETMNTFCYGNNRFGIFPDLIDTVSTTATYLTTSAMKNFVLDFYRKIYNIFYANNAGGGLKLTEEQRTAAWLELTQSINRKTNFSLLDGTEAGWPLAVGGDGPVIFTCDLPPSRHEFYGQWGRNVSTGAKPNASAILEHNPQAGPLRADGAVGYYDERTPEMSFVAFEKTYRGYIESELLLNPEGSCVGTCEDYHELSPLCTGSDHCSILKNYHCTPSEPNCLIRSCAVAKNCIRAAPVVQMCSAVNETGKAYDWMKFNSEKMIRRQNGTENEQCTDPGFKLSTAVERWDIENGIIMKAPVYCELCLCTCVTPQNQNEQDYFDLQSSLADIENGYVVSALKFVKEGHVIRLAVEQGKPLVNGGIDELSVKWVEPLPADLANPNKTCPLGAGGFTKLNFNLAVGGPGTVLTGIRFVVDAAKALTLQIQVTPITWSDGDKGLSPAKLVATEPRWISTPMNSTSPIGRQPLEFGHLLYNPTSQQGPSMPDAVLNTYVEFSTSSYETDLGQSIVPYFDALSVYYYEKGTKSWLRGAGILHKGKPNSTGFITPILVGAKPSSMIKYLPDTKSLPE